MLSATVRDIAIILIAIQSMVIGVLIGVLIWQIWRLVKIIQTEVKPIIDDAQASVETVRGTSAFVSEGIVQPVMRANRAVARWRGMYRSLTSELRSRPQDQAKPPKTNANDGPSAQS